jgi:hypothetical protein
VPPIFFQWDAKVRAFIYSTKLILKSGAFFSPHAQRFLKNFHFLKAEGKDTTTILSDKLFGPFLFTCVAHCQSFKELPLVKSGGKDKALNWVSKYF